MGRRLGVLGRSDPNHGNDACNHECIEKPHGPQSRPRTHDWKVVHARLPPHIVPCCAPADDPDMSGKINDQLENFFLTIHDLASGADEWASRPGWLEFSPNNLCNLRCIMCGQADGLPLEVMPKEEAVALLDDVLPHVSLMTPSALSEPMLANIGLVVEKCREHDVYLNFYSNATVLNGERFRKIADRLHKVWISFDSPVKAVFERLRTPAKFDQVVQNIREIISVAVELNVPLGFVAVLMRETVEHLPDLVDFLADLGAADASATLRVQAMYENSSRCAESDVHRFYTDEQICEHLDRACERARERNMVFLTSMQEPFSRSEVPVEPPIRGILPDVFIKLIDTIQRRYPRFCSMSISTF